MSQRNYCTICDAEVYLSDDHKVIDGGKHRQIVVDGERAHVLLIGGPLANVLKKIDSRASAAEIQILYKEPEASAEQPVEDAPVPVEEPPTDTASTDWFDSLMQEGLQ